MAWIPAWWREAGWPLLASLLLFLALLFFARGNADSARLTERVQRCEAARRQVEDGYADVYRVELALVGRRLTLPRLEPLSAMATKAHLAQGLQLLLLVSDISCNVCQDRETQFARSLSSKFGPEAVKVILSTEERRWASTYVRANGGHFPVYLAPQGGIAPNLPATPLLLLLDGDRVLAAHQPHPGQERLSEVFHATVERLLIDVQVGGGHG